MNDLLEKMNIYPNLQKLATFPKQAKNGILFMFAGWIWFFALHLFVYRIAVPWRQTVSGLLICYLIMTLKKWARILALLCNVFIILQTSAASAGFMERGQYVTGVVTLICVVLFGISGYYFLTKTSAAFFKSDRVEQDERNKK